MSEKYQGSHQSHDKREVTSLVPAPAPRPMAPGFRSREEWDNFQWLVVRAFKNRLANIQVKDEEGAIVLALKGRELGLEPVYALSQIYLVNGKAGLQSEVMRALVYRKYPNAVIRVVTPIDKRHLECTIEAARAPSDVVQQFSFTMEDAARAGMVRKQGERFIASPGKQVWDQYPQDMLVGRATSRAIRFLWPECVMGMGYTPEELQEAAPVNSGREVSQIDAAFDARPSSAPRAEEPASLPPAEERLDNMFAMKMEPNGEMVPVSMEEVRKRPEDVVARPPAELPAEELFPFEKPPSPAVRAPEPVAAPIPKAVARIEILPPQGERQYVIKFGRNIGKTFPELGVEKCRAYLVQVQNQSKKGEGNPAITELISELEKYLKGK